MNKLFWADEKRKVSKTYRDVVEDINSQHKIVKYIYTSNPYEMFIQIIRSVLAEKEVTLLDPDFSDVELINLGIEKDMLDEKYEYKKQKNYSNASGLVEDIKDNSNWRITLYTSGTTGRPKKVTHSIGSLTRMVRMGDKYSDNIWAFAYNPTHFAGLQVFFQAFFNMNIIVNVFDIDKRSIESVFNKYSITHISATPTYYRTMLPYFKSEYNTLLKLTSGGERFDNKLIDVVYSIFPNVRINNIYASTEAGSLFAAKGDVFKISEDIADRVRISEDGELLLSGDLVGESDDLVNNNGWYHTGDIVEREGDLSFRIVSRKNEMINVGGYKINPNEIEDIVLGYDGVLDVRITSEKNSVIGNILIACIVTDAVDKKAFEKDLKRYLISKLQAFKVPRIFKFVEEIEKTRTGKKVRE